MEMDTEIRDGSRRPLWLRLTWVALCFPQTQASEPVHKLWEHVHNCQAALNVQEGRGVMRGLAGGEMEEGKKAGRGRKGDEAMAMWTGSLCKALMMGKLCFSGGWGWRTERERRRGEEGGGRELGDLQWCYSMCGPQIAAWVAPGSWLER